MKEKFELYLTLIVRDKDEILHLIELLDCINAEDKPKITLKANSSEITAFVEDFRDVGNEPFTYEKYIKGE